MVRVIKIYISTNILNKDILFDMYNHFKHAIPKEFIKICEYDNSDGRALQLALREDSPEFHQALKFAESQNLAYRLFSDVHYTKRKLITANISNCI